MTRDYLKKREGEYTPKKKTESGRLYIGKNVSHHIVMCGRHAPIRGQSGRIRIGGLEIKAIQNRKR